MTLKEFMENRSVLATEYDEFRRRMSDPAYGLGWTAQQFSNRKLRKTALKNSEIFVLGSILYDIRHPKEK